MPNIKDAVYNRSQLFSRDGRDYIKIGDEIYSINGLYTDAQGNQDRYGQHVIIMDVRWPVLVHRQYDGQLEYQGDAHDIAPLLHWGYQWPSMAKAGYEQIPSGEERTSVTPQAVNQAPISPQGETRTGAGLPRNATPHTPAEILQSAISHVCGTSPEDAFWDDDSPWSRAYAILDAALCIVTNEAKLAALKGGK